MSASNPSLIVARHLSKIYRRGREDVRALEDVSFEIRQGEFVTITGPSGSGKSTLLNLLGCMDRPTSGELTIRGREVPRFSDSERTEFRRATVGFIFQHFGLLPSLSVAENIMLPLMFSGRPAGFELEDLLDRVQLKHRRDHRPNELSGGEMQRVAIARALIQRPALLLGDEPTGNLDSATGESLIALLKELHAGGLTIVIVTHNPAVAAVAGRSIVLRDGRLASPQEVGIIN